MIIPIDYQTIPQSIGVDSRLSNNRFIRVNDRDLLILTIYKIT